MIDGRDDGLGPARGCLHGLLLAAVAWLLMLGLGWAVTSLWLAWW